MLDWAERAKAFNIINEIQSCSAAGSQLEGLAVDSENQKLYYTDWWRTRIGVMSTDGSNHRVLMTVRHSIPHAIVLDSVHRYV